MLIECLSLFNAKEPCYDPIHQALSNLTYTPPPPLLQPLTSFIPLSILLLDRAHTLYSLAASILQEMVGVVGMTSHHIIRLSNNVFIYGTILFYFANHSFLGHRDSSLAQSVVIYSTSSLSFLSIYVINDASHTSH